MNLLEREPALTVLQGALGDVAHGEGRVALVYGEAGIGKTSLVDSFARARGQPGRTLWGACDSLHTPRPLGPVYDIAQQAGSTLLDRLEAGAPPRAIFSAVLEELRQRPPVIAVLEDLHWADAATLDLIRFLGRRIRQVPALLVLTYRDDELGPRHPLRIALGDLATQRGGAADPAARRCRSRRCGRSPPASRSTRRRCTGRPAATRSSSPRPSPAARRASRPRCATRCSPGPLASRPRAGPRSTPRRSSAPRSSRGCSPRWSETRPPPPRSASRSGCSGPRGTCWRFRHELARQAILDTIAPPRRLALHRLALRGARVAPDGLARPGPARPPRGRRRRCAGRPGPRAGRRRPGRRAGSPPGGRRPVSPAPSASPPPRRPASGRGSSTPTRTNGCSWTASTRRSAPGGRGRRCTARPATAAGRPEPRGTRGGPGPRRPQRRRPRSRAGAPSRCCARLPPGPALAYALPDPGEPADARIATAPRRSDGASKAITLAERLRRARDRRGRLQHDGRGHAGLRRRPRARASGEEPRPGARGGAARVDRRRLHQPGLGVRRGVPLRRCRPLPDRGHPATRPSAISTTPRTTCRRGWR